MFIEDVAPFASRSQMLVNKAFTAWGFFPDWEITGARVVVVVVGGDANLTSSC